MEMMLINFISIAHLVALIWAIAHLVALIWAIGLAVIANMESCDG